MIVMRYGNILGDVQDPAHVNWIQLSSVSLGIARPVTNPTGPAAGRVLAAPRLQELTITKDEDVATIGLIAASLVGGPSEAQIDFLRTGTNQQEVYYSIAMKEVLITGFNQSSAGERPIESLTLNFAAIQFYGTQMASDGSGVSPSSFGWNLVIAESS